MERLMGVETEYAVNAQGQYDAESNREQQLWLFMDLARREQPYLRDFGPGMFLENGARFYVDCGSHPEFSTPECADPWEVVRYILAGEEMLSGLAAKFNAGEGEDALTFFKCNVDYSGAGTTWGCHESYLHRMNPEKLSAEIIPHLVSRIIYTGAGGFDSLSSGLSFTLSPRVPHLGKVVSEHSTHERGLFHTKDESLSSGGFHRLHLICGESLCSQTAMWLKVATTALVVAMAEAGVRFSEAVGLRAPLTALKGFAFNTECKAEALVVNGKWMTAIEIQRFYLERAEKHLRASFMPAWAKEACREWRLMLERLDKGPEAVKTTLDWAIKLALYKDYARRQGFEWQQLPHWTYVHNSLRSALQIANYDEKSISIESVVGPGSPILYEVERLEPYLRKHGLSWGGLSQFLQLRRQLLEIDTRFGQLGDKGIFAELSRQGVLAHEIEGIDNISAAMKRPPAAGRARLRGQTVKRFAYDRENYECDWQGVWDRRNGLVLDLSDPFTNVEKWLRLDDKKEDRYAIIPDGLRERIRYLEEGRYYYY
jgi:proteasome accessory factor A